MYLTRSPYVQFQPLRNPLPTLARLENCSIRCRIERRKKVAIHIYNIPEDHLNATRPTHAQDNKVSAVKGANRIPAWPSHMILGEPSPRIAHVIAQGNLLCSKVGSISREGLNNLCGVVRGKVREHLLVGERSIVLKPGRE